MTETLPKLATVIVIILVILHMVRGTEYLTGFIRILVQSEEKIVPAKFRRLSK